MSRTNTSKPKESKALKELDDLIEEYKLFKRMAEEGYPDTPTNQLTEDICSDRVGVYRRTIRRLEKLREALE